MNLDEVDVWIQLEKVSLRFFLNLSRMYPFPASTPSFSIQSKLMLVSSLKPL
jgi:hypothetical protein